MGKYRTRYVYSRRFGNANHSYELIGEKGGIHLHINDMGEEFAVKHVGQRYSAGIEIHSRTGSGAPSHDECWLLKCPCWHDGSSLYAQEYWVPLFESGTTPEEMLRRLEGEADRRFEKDAE